MKDRIAATRIAAIGVGTFLVFFLSDLGLIKEASAAKDALFAAIDGCIAAAIAAAIQWLHDTKSRLPNPPEA